MTEKKALSTYKSSVKTWTDESLEHWKNFLTMMPQSKIADDIFDIVNGEIQKRKERRERMRVLRYPGI